MIYHLSLKTAALLAGIFLVLIGAAALVNVSAAKGCAQRFPRSRIAAVTFLTLDVLWTFWLLATMEMGEFSNFRVPLLIALPIGYILVLRYVDELLAPRALGILCLLAAEPLLEAAFLRYEPSRLLVTVFAYLLIIAGLFWSTMPYLLRDQINWCIRSSGRWSTVYVTLLLFGAAILACAFTLY